MTATVRVTCDECGKEAHSYVCHRCETERCEDAYREGQEHERESHEHEMNASAEKVAGWLERQRMKPSQPTPEQIAFVEECIEDLK